MPEHPPYCTCAECTASRSAGRPTVYQRTSSYRGTSHSTHETGKDSGGAASFFFWMFFLLFIIAIAGLAVWLFAPEWAEQTFGLGGY
jgi:hypothetical protein